MAVGQQTVCLLFLYLVIVVACVSAQTGSTAPDVKTIIARMAQARAENRAHLRPYIVTRNYKLFGKERYKTKAQVIVDVSFVPPNSKQFAIEQSNGTGLGERIVRQILESEAEVAKDYRSTDISPDNYDFRFIREEEAGGQRCYVLELLPRRIDTNLLRGNIWVDASTYLLHRVDGGPAKSPSWWLRDVRIVLLYSNVGGMWLQTASEATAKVRILGQHSMVARVLLSSDAVEADVLQETLSEYVILTCARNRRELQALLGSDNYDVLFCSKSFRTLNDALVEVRQRYPKMPVIILSRTTVAQQWVEVLAGAFDLLIPPYEQRALRSGLEPASASRDARVSRSILQHTRRKKRFEHEGSSHGLLVPSS